MTLTVKMTKMHAGKFILIAITTRDTNPQKYVFSRSPLPPRPPLRHIQLSLLLLVSEFGRTRPVVRAGRFGRTGHGRVARLGRGGGCVVRQLQL